MTSMIKRWKALAFKERMTWLAIGTLTIAGLYGLLLYPNTHKAVTHAENMVNRKLNRIETRTRSVDKLGPSTGSLKSEIQSLRKTRETLEAELAGLEARFVAEGDINEQSLLLDISALAQRSGLAIRSQGNLAGQARPEDVPAKRRDHRTDRPVITLSARGGYWELLDFLEGLKRLEYISAPIALHLAPAEFNAQETEAGEGGKRAAPMPLSFLDVRMTLTL